MSPSVFIIVPAYNEAPVIRSTIKHLLDLNHKVVVVDDGSIDDTWLELSSLTDYSKATGQSMSNSLNIVWDLLVGRLLK